MLCKAKRQKIQKQNYDGSRLNIFLHSLRLSLKRKSSTGFAIIMPAQKLLPFASPFPDSEGCGGCH
jgi:hypothetical protein